jgi:hypothetical protein
MRRVSYTMNPAVQRMWCGHPHTHEHYTEYRDDGSIWSVCPVTQQQRLVRSVWKVLPHLHYERCDICGYRNEYECIEDCDKPYVAVGALHPVCVEKLVKSIKTSQDM